MEATILNHNQVFNTYDDREEKQLQIFKDYGTKTGLSDLAIFLGGRLGLPLRNPDKTSDGQRSGFVYTASSARAEMFTVPIGKVSTVAPTGRETQSDSQSRTCGIRLALPPEVTSSILPDKEKTHPKNQSLRIVEYGEYPQSIAYDSEALEHEFQKQPFVKTGAQYTFDGEAADAHDKPFNPIKYDEYEHDDKRYIRVEARPTVSYKECLDGHLESNAILSNGQEVKEGDIGWIEVQPVEWLADPSGWWVTKQGLVAGVQYDVKRKYDGNFNETNANKFINEVMLKEILPERDRAKIAGTIPPTRADGNNWIDSLGGRSGRKIGE
ncbi:MAG: hypothetical protein SFW64_07870 [Alphaproteobacteria bacterium]|nr:hypothetical protein [Alphaproteobacteria bacterium]